MSKLNENCSGLANNLFSVLLFPILHKLTASCETIKFLHFIQNKNDNCLIVVI